MGKQIIVLYVAGWGRSGTTLIDNILGQIPGFFSVGELRYVWDRSILEDRPCGCGLRFSQCPVWQEVLQRAFGGRDTEEAQQMVALRSQLERTRHLPSLLLFGNRYRARPAAERYSSSLERLYRAISEVTQAEVIVDSSKFPSYAWYLDGIDDLDLRVVHVVRDPRGVAFSWLRKTKEPDIDGLRGSRMLRFHPVTSTAIWTIWNLAIERLWGADRARYHLLRYEDLAEDAEKAIAPILDMLGCRTAGLPFIDPLTVKLKATHTTSGNPSRFRTGVVSISGDYEWRTAMSGWHRGLVRVIGWPLLRHYGYR